MKLQSTTDQRYILVKINLDLEKMHIIIVNVDDLRVYCYLCLNWQLFQILFKQNKRNFLTFVFIYIITSDKNLCS